MGPAQTLTVERFSLEYERCLPPIARYLGRRLGDVAAEDATAEVFERAFRERDRYRSGGAESPLPWLYAIANNVIAETRRTERKRLKAIEHLARERERTYDQDPGSASDPLDVATAKALRRLKSADRDTLLLIAWGELSYEEVAQVLDVPVGTVRSRVSRARKQLDAALSGSTSRRERRHTQGEPSA